MNKTINGKIFSWTLFDFGNTAFSVIIVTVIYSKYFSNHVAGGQQWLWGLAVSCSMIITAVLTPPLGAVADLSRNRKRLLLAFTILCILCTFLMSNVYQGDILLGFVLFVLANIGFEGGLVFYDAFLPGITSKDNYGKVSGYGFAMGYLGALAILVIVMMILPASTSPNYYSSIRFTFIIASVFFLIFSSPLFLFIREPAKELPLDYKKKLFDRGIKSSIDSFKSIFIRKEYPSIKRFLISFFLYNDGIITIIAFASIFAMNVLKMNDQDIIIFFIIVQSTAILGSFVFGYIADKIGPKKTISITLILWIIIIIGSLFVNTVFQFYILGLLSGISMGSSQSSSRSLMALLIPKEREAEFFGFYDGLFGKSSAILGPLVYGFISDFSNERIAAGFIGLFFLSGLILLQKVNEPANK